MMHEDTARQVDPSSREYERRLSRLRDEITALTVLAQKAKRKELVEKLRHVAKAAEEADILLIEENQERQINPSH